MAGRSELTRRSASRSTSSGVAGRAGRGAVGARLGDHRVLEGDLTVEHIAGNLEVRRPRRAAEALARGHRHHVRDALGGGDGGGELGDRAHQVDVRQVLEPPHAMLGLCRLAADMQHRTLRAERGRDPGDGIRAPGTGGGHHAPEPAGLARVAVRRVRRDLLVAHVDDLDPLVDAPVVDVDDVAAAEREDGIDAFAPEGLRDEVAAGDDIGVPALLRERVFGGSGRNLLGCSGHGGSTLLEAIRPVRLRVQITPRCRPAYSSQPTNSSTCRPRSRVCWRTRRSASSVSRASSASMMYM